MKFRETISPFEGHSIYCSSKYEAKKLLEQLEKLGYSGNVPCSIGFYRFMETSRNLYKVIEYSSLGWEDDKACIQFFDLIETDITALDAVKWLKYSDRDMRLKVFGCESVDNILQCCHSEEIIERIDEYEKKKKLKSIKIEWEYYCSIIDANTRRVVYDIELEDGSDIENFMESALKEYTMGHDGEYKAVINGLGTVKHN